MSAVASYAPGGFGPWTVQLKGVQWWIVHPTKRGKRIGPVQLVGRNNYHEACEEAERRNKAEAKT